MSEKEMTIKNNTEIPQQFVGEAMIIEEFSADKALQRVNEVIKFVDGLRGILKKGEDYNTHSGYQKPALEKPGAEKILVALNYAPKIIKGEEGVVWNKEYGLREYHIMTHLISKATGTFAGSGVGYHRAEIEDIMVHEKDKNGKWVKDSDGTWKMKIDKTRVSWANNAALKMADKSSFIASSLKAGAISGYFTQDPKNEVDNGKAKPSKEKSASPPSSVDPSAKQMDMIAKILKSHLLLDFEQYRLQKHINKDMTKEAASKYIDWWIGDKSLEHKKRQDMEKADKKNNTETLKKYLGKTENHRAEKYPIDYKEFLETISVKK